MRFNGSTNAVECAPPVKRSHWRVGGGAKVASALGGWLWTRCGLAHESQGVSPRELVREALHHVDKLPSFHNHGAVAAALRNTRA